jgi:membrane-associated phospholipid phosphatase
MGGKHEMKLTSLPGFTLLICLLLAPVHHAMAASQAEDNGDFLRTLIPAVAYGATFYMHDSEGRVQFYKSFFTNLGVTYALKAAVSKTRPNGTDDDSFPSGHSSVAFQGAAFIHKRYGLKVSIPAYLAATYVAWSRVDSDNHYTVDVVAGAAIGIASSFIFTRPYKGFVVTPLAAGGFYGIEVSRRW